MKGEDELGCEGALTQKKGREDEGVLREEQEQEQESPK